MTAVIEAQDGYTKYQYSLSNIFCNCKSPLAIYLVSGRFFHWFFCFFFVFFTLFTSGSLLHFGLSFSLWALFFTSGSLLHFGLSSSRWAVILHVGLSFFTLGSHSSLGLSSSFRSNSSLELSL